VAIERRREEAERCGKVLSWHGMGAVDGQSLLRAEPLMGNASFAQSR